MKRNKLKKRFFKETPYWWKDRDGRPTKEYMNWLEDKLIKQLSLNDVDNGNSDEYKKGFDLAMNYINTTTINVEQSKESEELWEKLKDFYRKINNYERRI